jgi:hypothetical protein
MPDMNTYWKPEFEPWRQGTWLVKDVDFPDGTRACVSSDYPDGKWRIICDESFTPYPTRDAAARGARTLAHHKHLTAASAVTALAALASMVMRLAPPTQAEQGETAGWREKAEEILKSNEGAGPDAAKFNDYNFEDLVDAYRRGYIQRTTESSADKP